MKKLHLVFLSGFFSLLLLSPVFAARYDHGMPGIYNLTPFTLGDGEGSGLSTDSSGRILISPSSTISTSPSVSSDSAETYFFSKSTTSTVSIASSSSRLYGMFADNLHSSRLYVQFHNTSTTPLVGATPTLAFSIGGGNQMILDSTYFRYLQAYFSEGIAMTISSSFSTNTPSSNYGLIDVMVQYE